jgi:hypothetical protein
MDVDLLCSNRLAAFRARHDGIEHLPASLVLVHLRPAPLTHHVPVTPIHEGHHDRMQVQTTSGRDIPVPGRTLSASIAPQFTEPHEPS